MCVLLLLEEEMIEITSFKFNFFNFFNFCQNIHHLEVPTLVQHHDEILEEEQPTTRKTKKRELDDGDNNIEGGREDKIAKIMPADDT